MSGVLTEPPLTFEAYMAWKAEQPERHEFFAGEVFAMTGARATHNAIALNIAVALRDASRCASSLASTWRVSRCLTPSHHCGQRE